MTTGEVNTIAPLGYSDIRPDQRDPMAQVLATIEPATGIMWTVVVFGSIMAGPLTTDVADRVETDGQVTVRRRRRVRVVTPEPKSFLELTGGVPKN